MFDDLCVLSYDGIQLLDFIFPFINCYAHLNGLSVHVPRMLIYTYIFLTKIELLSC